MYTNQNGETEIDIPNELLITNSEKSLLSLVDFVYPNILEHIHQFFSRGCNTCSYIISYWSSKWICILFHSWWWEKYLSYDTPYVTDMDEETQGDWFTSEFLNEITCSTIPNHCLRLKVGVPIMLLRNIDQSNDLRNEIRLQVR